MSQIDLKPHERKIKARFYRWVWNTHSGHWERAAAELKAFTGVSIPHETLRQNIAPVNQTMGEAPRSFRDPRRLRALKDFLISVNYLFEDELQKADTFSYLAELFSQFVSGNHTSLNTRPLERFRGLFRGGHLTTIARESLEIYIDYLSPDQPVAATEFSTTYDFSDENPQDQETSEGWTICNEQGFYLFLLGNVYTAKCYLVLQTTPSITSERPINTIGLLRYESAITGEIQNVTTFIDKDDQDSTQSEFRLSTTIENLCFFLTRA